MVLMRQTTRYEPLPKTSARHEELGGARQVHRLRGLEGERREPVGVLRLAAGEHVRHRRRHRAVVERRLRDRHHLRVAELTLRGRERELVRADRDAVHVVAEARVVRPDHRRAGDLVAHELGRAPGRGIGRGGVGDRDRHDERELGRVLLDEVREHEGVVVRVVDDLRVEGEVPDRVGVQSVELDRRHHLDTGSVVDRDLGVHRRHEEGVAERPDRVGRDRERVREPVEPEDGLRGTRRRSGGRDVRADRRPPPLREDVEGGGTALRGSAVPAVHHGPRRDPGRWTGGSVPAGGGRRCEQGRAEGHGARDTQETDVPSHAIPLASTAPDPIRGREERPRTRADPRARCAFVAVDAVAARVRPSAHMAERANRWSWRRGV